MNTTMRKDINSGAFVISSQQMRRVSRNDYKSSENQDRFNPSDRN
jgi:hypothetical protein